MASLNPVTVIILALDFFRKSTEGESTTVATFFPESCSILEIVVESIVESVSTLAIPAIIEVAKMMDTTIQVPAITLPKKVMGALSP